MPASGPSLPFGAVQRNIANKTISKWARALQYVAHWTMHPIRLETFVREMGGVNACAGR
jgi:hypothetical protein